MFYNKRYFCIFKIIYEIYVQVWTFYKTPSNIHQVQNKATFKNWEEMKEKKKKGKEGGTERKRKKKERQKEKSLLYMESGIICQPIWKPVYFGNE